MGKSSGSGMGDAAALAPACARCAADLCLRKQVINLAYGNTDRMYCLSCLGAEGARSACEVLTGMKDYILGRECFAKQWHRYARVEDCPDPDRCFPGLCFEPGIKSIKSRAVE